MGEIFVGGVPGGRSADQSGRALGFSVREHVGQAKMRVDGRATRLLPDGFEPVVVTPGAQLLRGGFDRLLQCRDAALVICGVPGISEVVLEGPEVDVDDVGVEVVAAAGVDHGWVRLVGGGLSEASA